MKTRISPIRLLNQNMEGLKPAHVVPDAPVPVARGGTQQAQEPCSGPSTKLPSPPATFEEVLLFLRELPDDKFDILDFMMDLERDYRLQKRKQSCQTK